jgi:hypothetical protein
MKVVYSDIHRRHAPESEQEGGYNLENLGPAALKLLGTLG